MMLQRGGAPGTKKKYLVDQDRAVRPKKIPQAVFFSSFWRLRHIWARLGDARQRFSPYVLHPPLRSATLSRAEASFGLLLYCFWWSYVTLPWVHHVTCPWVRHVIYLPGPTMYYLPRFTMGSPYVTARRSPRPARRPGSRVEVQDAASKCCCIGFTGTMIHLTGSPCYTSLGSPYYISGSS